MIYFVQAVDGGNIKIGTTIRLSLRLKELARDYGREFRVLAVTSGSYAEERALHEKFSHVFVEGEWFKDSLDVYEFMQEECRPWDGSDELRMCVVKVESDVLRDARIVCSITGEDLQDYLTRVLEPIVARDKDLAFEKERAAKEQAKSKKKPPTDR